MLRLTLILQSSLSCCPQSYAGCFCAPQYLFSRGYSSKMNQPLKHSGEIALPFVICCEAQFLVNTSQGSLQSCCCLCVTSVNIADSFFTAVYIPGADLCWRSSSIKAQKWWLVAIRGSKDGLCACTHCGWSSGWAAGFRDGVGTAAEQWGLGKASDLTGKQMRPVVLLLLLTALLQYQW